jgi:DNA invertase Pin-like site-specific DNA recombinase
VRQATTHHRRPHGRRQPRRSRPKLLIDEDQGRSGASAEGRLGFQRLLAEVGLDHVGLILGLEMSRLARSCHDWHQLLELCGIFRTLLADQDGLYDPTGHNDRLPLGLHRPFATMWRRRG